MQKPHSDSDRRRDKRGRNPEGQRHKVETACKPNLKQNESFIPKLQNESLASTCADSISFVCSPIRITEKSCEELSPLLMQSDPGLCAPFRRRRSLSDLQNELSEALDRVDRMISPIIESPYQPRVRRMSVT